MFRPDPHFAEELQKQPGFRDGLKEAAEPVRRLADNFARRAGAPWLLRRGEHNLIALEETPEGVRVVNLDSGGHLQEWGGRNSPPHAPLRRAVRAAGLRLKEEPKQ